MKKLTLLIFGLFTTLAIAQQSSIATLTVSDIQKIFESESDKAATQRAFQGFFNGYGLGFSDGVASALAQAGIVSEDVAIKFVDCSPNSRNLFYEMLSVTDERASMNIAVFTRKAYIDGCYGTILELLNPP